MPSTSVSPNNLLCGNRSPIYLQFLEPIFNFSLHGKRESGAEQVGGQGGDGDITQSVGLLLSVQSPLLSNVNGCFLVLVFHFHEK